MLNKENLTKSLEQIKVSQELDEKILNKTIYSTETKYLALRKVILTIILIFTFTITTVFAREIIYKCILNKTPISKDTYEQYLSIKDYVRINNEDIICNDKTTLQEIEQALNIKFVFDSTKYNPLINKCIIKKDNRDNIESITLEIPEFYDYSKENKNIDQEYNEDFTIEEYYKWESKRKKISLSISFMTQYASTNTKSKFANLDIIISTGNKGLEATEFYAPNINTQGYYFISPSKNIPITKEVIFVTKNILYVFDANKQVSIEELLKIINSF